MKKKQNPMIVGQPVLIVVDIQKVAFDDDGSIPLMPGTIERMRRARAVIGGPGRRYSDHLPAGEPSENGRGLRSRNGWRRGRASARRLERYCQASRPMSVPYWLNNSGMRLSDGSGWRMISTPACCSLRMLSSNAWAIWGSTASLYKPSGTIALKCLSETRSASTANACITVQMSATVCQRADAVERGRERPNADAGKTAGIVIEPAAPTYNLDELLAGITANNLHDEQDFGLSQGKELL